MQCLIARGQVQPFDEDISRFPGLADGHREGLWPRKRLTPPRPDGIRAEMTVYPLWTKLRTNRKKAP
eukprot:125325-Pyramimonas_sp.AAC.1